MGQGRRCVYSARFEAPPLCEGWGLWSEKVYYILRKYPMDHQWLHETLNKIQEKERREGPYSLSWEEKHFLKILDKISEDGSESLSPSEKDFLQSFGQACSAHPRKVVPFRAPKKEEDRLVNYLPWVGDLFFWCCSLPFLCCQNSGIPFTTPISLRGTSGWIQNTSESIIRRSTNRGPGR